MKTTYLVLGYWVITLQLSQVRREMEGGWTFGNGRQSPADSHGGQVEHPIRNDWRAREELTEVVNRGKKSIARHTKKRSGDVSGWRNATVGAAAPRPTANER